MDPDNLNTENPGSGHNYAVDSTPCSGMPYNAFHQLLVSNRDKMLAYGRQVTMDTLQITIHEFSFRNPTGINEAGDVAARLALAVEPNPNRGPVAISYTLARPGLVRVAVFAEDGRLVVRLPSRSQAPGRHSITWDRRDGSGTRVPNGSYLVRLVSGGLAGTTRLVIAGD